MCVCVCVHVHMCVCVCVCMLTCVWPPTHNAPYMGSLQRLPLSTTTMDEPLLSRHVGRQSCQVSQFDAPLGAETNKDQ